MNLTPDEYMKLAEKYEGNKEVRDMVVFTYRGTRLAYGKKGFVRGLIVGAVLQTLLSLLFMRAF